MNVSACPANQDLEQLLLGRVSGPVAAALEQHLDACPRCSHALTTLKAEDTLLEAARGAPPWINSPPECELLEDMLTRPAAGGQATVGTNQPPPHTITAVDEMQDVLAPAQRPDEIGRLGPYRVLKLLGSGGMGAVFLAEDPHLDRPIALKVIKPAVMTNPSARQRFLREAKACAALKSEHVVTIYQVAEDRCVPFIAMEFLEGEPLDKLLQSGRQLPMAEILRIGREIAQGLAAAHGKGLIHRDIKPANVWLDENSGKVKLLDFGLARTQEEDVHLTASGAVVGTPAYMAPEQARGDTLDARCDLFSLGVVLYRLCTGELPFKGGTTMAVLTALAMDKPRTASDVNPTVPQELSNLIQRLLAKMPQERPASAKEVVKALQAIEGTLGSKQTSAPVALPVEATACMLPAGIVPVPVTPVRPQPVHRRRGLVAVAAAALVGVGGWLLAPLILRITGKDGQVRDVPLNPGDRIEVVQGPVPAPGASPLDALDPAQIPVAERFPWQPKELVAVIGEHRGRHWGSISRIRISSDGKTVASVGNHVRLWDAKTLREQGVIPMHAVTDAAFNPKDGTLTCTGLMQGGAGQLIAMWDVSGAAPKLRAQAATVTNVSCVAYAPDGVTLAGGCPDGTVRLWDVSGENPKEKAVLKGHTAGIQMVAFSPDGKSLASCSRGSRDKSVRIWDLAAEKPIDPIVFTSHVEGLAGLTFAPDGKTLATADEDHTVRLWDLTGAKPREKASLRDSTHELAFTPDGKTLVCRNPHNGWLRIMDVAGALPRERSVIKVGTGTFALAPDGKSLVTAERDQTCLLQWDLTGDQPQERLEPQGHTSRLAGVVLAPDGKTLASYAHNLPSNAQRDRLVRLWDLSGTAPRQRAELRHENFVSGVAFSPDSKTLASCSHDAVRLWDLTAAEPVERIGFKAVGAVQSLAFAPDGKTLACDDAKEKNIRLWDVSGEEPKERTVLPNSAAPFAFAPDGKTLACNRLVKGNMRSPLLWDLSGPEPKERPELKPTTADLILADNLVQMTWAPDGKTFACSWWLPGAPVLVMWDMSGSKPKEQTLLRLGSWYGAWPTSLAFAPDGQSIAVACPEEVLLWDVANRNKPKRRSWRLSGAVGGVTFSQDGRHLITANANGTAYVLRLEGPVALAVEPKPPSAQPLTLDAAKIPAEERFPWQPKELVAVIGEHRGRHWGGVGQVFYSPDGKFVATVGNSGVILWDPQTLRQGAFLPGVTGAVAVSPDSNILAVVAGGDTVRLWDVGGGEPKERTVICPGEVVLSLAFSPDGKTLAGGCRAPENSSPVRLWDVSAEKPKEKAVLKGHKGAFHAPVAFSSDGKTLASGGDDKTVRLWDLTAAEPKETAVLTTHTEAVGGLAFSPDGKTLATHAFDATLRLWDVTGARPKERAVVQNVSGRFSMAFTPDSKTLACNLPAGGTGLLDVTGPEPTVKAALKGMPSGLLALSPDGKALVTTDGMALRMWDLTGNEPRERLEPQGHTAALGSLALTPDGTKVAIGGGDGVARLWDLTGPAPREWAVLRDLGSVNSAAFAPNGKILAIGSGGGLFLWNVTATDLEERAVVKQWGGLRWLAFSPDGKTLLCSGIAEDQHVTRLLDVTEAEPRERAVLKGDAPHNYNAVPALSPDGKTLALSQRGPEGLVVGLWDLTGAAPKERAALKAPAFHYSASAMAWSPDGNTLAASFQGSGGPARTLLLWDLSAAEPREQCNLATEHLPAATALAFSLDGSTLAYAGSEGQLILWDVVGHRNLRELSRDYKDGDGQMVLWDAVSKKHHNQRRWQLPGAVLKLAFAPDGRHLITANGNGTAYVLRLAPPPELKP